MSEKATTVCTPRFAFEIAKNFCRVLDDIPKETHNAIYLEILNELYYAQNKDGLVYKRTLTCYEEETNKNIEVFNLDSDVTELPYNLIALMHLTRRYPTRYEHAAVLVCDRESIFLFDPNRGAILVEDIDRTNHPKNYDVLSHFWKNWNGVDAMKIRDTLQFQVHWIRDIKKFNYSKNAIEYHSFDNVQRLSILSPLFYQG
jgi:hypothetical protein